MQPTSPNRRPLRSRGTAWARTLSRGLIACKATPNAISALSVAAAAAAGACVLIPVWWPNDLAWIFGLIGGACLIQVRLLANLMDGMVAVEGGMGSRSGEVWNDAPDRLADLLILVPVGYLISTHAWGPELSWAAGCGALLTAHARTLGGACGQAQDFCGPMAKPQRMAVMTVGFLVAAACVQLTGRDWILTAALVLVIIGSLLTTVRRWRRLCAALEADR